MGHCRTGSAILAMMVFALACPVVSGDSVISSESVEILDAGRFHSSSEWSFSSSTGFTSDQAEYTIGMIADGEMSFTHSRPDNFDEYTSWASSGCSECNATFGEPDGFYSWSMGPDITMGGYIFSGLHSMEIENVSLILHFSIPDPLPSDEVNVIMQNHGSDILITTFARTLDALDRMSNPLVLNLDDEIEWDWSKLEQTQFNVDYVSDNQGADDSEVRVDAVGLRVKFHQPWFSFENARAEHSTTLNEVPIIDISTYEGETTGLSHSTCGLIPEGDSNGSWEFHVSPPPGQELGRIHVSGTGNYTVMSSSDDSGGEYSLAHPAQLIENPEHGQNIRIELQDGCIHGARVDINDPHLTVIGRVSGGFSGLSEESSYIRFAVGNLLVHTEEMDAGGFVISIPIGHVLPEEGGFLEVGVATRFQWSSNGTAESTVVHIESMSISGGFTIDWDRDPFCEEIGDIALIEDGGGQIISLPPICSDDITDPQDLVVSAVSSDEGVLKASGSGGLLTIEPEEEASGVADVSVTVYDEAGNYWEGSFTVEIQSVNDPPEIVHLPGYLYIELGDSYEITPDLFDPDSFPLAVTTSRSWANVGENGSILIEPVEVGEHVLRISVSDGISEISREITIFVTSKPDLLVESLEIRVGGEESQSLSEGDVIELIGFIRNQGRGSAENVTFYCRIDGILIGTGTIAELGPGDLKMAVCDFQLMETSEIVTFLMEVDGTNTIDETIEGNNIVGVEMPVETPGGRTGSNGGGSTIAIISFLLVLISIAGFQLGPKSPKKEFERRK
ncbi:MAG: CARDB domain-containing protein [Candidatus Thalassarchaeaceae archaeon]|nr:CARDB domain-containing protein [Candidatus Thalassarchaeaceae archaeon]